MNLLSIWRRLYNLIAPSNSPLPSTTETSPVTLSPGNSEGIESPWWKLYFKLKEAHAFDNLNPSVVRGNGSGDLVYEAFDSLVESKETEDVAWLLLTSLDKCMKERNELHDKICQFQMQINNLKVSKCALEENLLSSSQRAQVAENQNEALIMRLAELQQKIKSQPQTVLAVKGRALIAKEQDPITWHGDVWGDPVEAENFGPSEVVSSAPPLEMLLFSAEEINPSLSAKPAVSVFEENVRQDKTDAPQGSPITSTTRLKAKQAPRGEVGSVVHEEAHYTTKELNEFANSFMQKSGEYVWEWILRVWDNGGRDIKLDQAGFIDMGPLSRDFRFNMEARRVKKGVRSLFEWLAEVFIKRWPTEKELEMPAIPWLSVDEGILRLREIAMLKWIRCVKPNPPQWEGPEDMPFTSPIRRKLVRGAPAHLKNFVLALFLVPDLRVGDAVAQLDELNSMGLTGPRGNMDQVAALNRQRRGDHSRYNGQYRQNIVYNDIPCNGQHRKGEIYNGMTRRDLWYWLINYGVSRHEIDRKSTAYLFDLYKQKNSQK
jgi:hypothetical protein